MQKNRQTIEAISQQIELSADDEQFFRAVHRSLDTPIHALVVSEDWCPDCALNVPVLMTIAALNPAFEVRFLKKDEADDILAFAMKGDRKAIPTIFFFDHGWREIGHWVERPVRADVLLAEWDRTHPTPREPDRTADVWKDYRHARSAYRDEIFFAQRLWQQTIEELRRILARAVFSNVIELSVPVR